MTNFDEDATPCTTDQFHRYSIQVVQYEAHKVWCVQPHSVKPWPPGVHGFSDRQTCGKGQTAKGHGRFSGGSGAGLPLRPGGHVVDNDIEAGRTSLSNDNAFGMTT